MPSFPPTRGTTGKRKRLRRRLRCRIRSLGALLAVAGCSSLLAARDSESQVRRILDGLSAADAHCELAHRTAVLKVDLSEIVVDDHDPPSALFHVKAAGTWGGATLGYYGSERITFDRANGSLKAPTVWLPRLDGVLAALAARERAIASGDATALARLAGPDNHDGAITQARLGDSLKAAASRGTTLAPRAAINLRIDGDRAEVSLVDSPVDLPGSSSASLVRLGDSWRFTSGLL